MAEIQFKDAHTTKKNRFVIVSTKLVNDMSLSGDCVRMLIYLLAKPDDWTITVELLHKQLAPSGIGRKKVYKMINEAIEAGYMKRERTFRGNLSSETKYFISENPKFKKSFRRGTLGQVPNGHILPNTELLPNIESKNNTKSPKPTPPSSAIIFHKKIGDAGIMESEYNQLSEKTGKIQLDETIKSMLEWIAQDPGRRRFKQKGIIASIVKWHEKFIRNLVEV